MGEEHCFAGKLIAYLLNNQYYVSINKAKEILKAGYYSRPGVLNSNGCQSIGSSLKRRTGSPQANVFIRNAQ